jgi:pimeloyl-ACP methyl ester carboxylesterase
VKTEGVAAFAEGFLKAVFAESTFQTNPSAVSMIRNIITSNSPIGICGTLLALAARTDTTAVLSTIKVPTLILVGAEDKLTPPSASESMRDRIAKSEMHILPKAAHMSNIENSEEFNAHVNAFLKRLL